MRDKQKHYKYTFILVLTKIQYLAASKNTYFKYLMNYITLKLSDSINFDLSLE